MKPVRTLIIIADDENARFVLNEGVGKGLRECAVLSVAQFAEDTITYEDRPGRGSGGPAGRHGYESGASADEMGRDRFARHLSQALDQEWRELGPDRLILVAPPKMLGTLRGRIAAVARGAVSAELAKDLVKVPLADLTAHLEGVLVA